MRTALSRSFAALTTVAFVASLDAQDQVRDARVMAATGTASVVGTVVSIGSPSRPLRDATVTISTTYHELTRKTVTDDGGRFTIGGLPAGAFTVSVEKAGYRLTESATKSNLATLPVMLADGQRQTLAVEMTRGAAIAGRVLDAYGRPQPDVQLSALRTRLSREQRVQDLVGATGMTLAVTDDAGTFRFYGLLPGDYVIRATPGRRPDLRPVTQAEILWAQQLAQSGGQAFGATTPAPAVGGAMALPPAYYPGVSDLSAATVITVAASEEREGLDFTLLPVPTSKIEGTVVDANGRPAPGIEVSLLSADSSPGQINSGIPASRTDRAGAFHFDGQFPGTYTLIVLSQSPAAADSPARSSSWARQSVSLNGNDLTDVMLRLQPSLSISGRIVLETTTPTDFGRVSLRLLPLGGAMMARTEPGRPTSDGSFVFRDLLPDRYSVAGETAPVAAPAASAGAIAKFSLPTSWVTKSVIVNGVETIDTGIDVSTGDVPDVVVTLTDRRAQISGTLRDEANRQVSGGEVAVFSVDEKSWKEPLRRVFWTATDDHGAFTITVGRPGEYYLVSRADINPQDLRDPSYLESLVPASIKISLAEGEKKSQDLKLSGGSRP